MAYTSINAYDADWRIPEFKGLMQYGDQINSDPRYASEAKNLDTPGGVLQPFAAPEAMPMADMLYPLKSLAILHRRWYTGDSPADVLFAAMHGSMYWAYANSNSWTAVTMPDGISAYQSDEWSWVNYEINPVGSTASVDILLISNALDGMYMIYWDDTAQTFVTTAIETPYKFGVIERYAERIWGGAIPDEPDTLAYSAPYDPTNWEANPDIPEDGAGDIRQPSWDGDSFTALKAFGSQLIAFKRTRVWRVLGTDPGEYTFKEQYGGGAPYAGTIAVDSERVFALAPDGPVVYDGLAVQPFAQEYLQGIVKTFNTGYLKASSACLYKGKYFISLPTGSSTVNNLVLIYNTVDGTWLMRDDLKVERFLPTEYALYFTNSDTPGCLYQYMEDAWEATATTGATRWVSPWNDLNSKYINKGGFDLYFLMEVKQTAATIKLSIQTEKKTKTKTYTQQPLGTNGKLFRQKRLHFGGTGRRFRLIIESAEGTPAWRLVSGIHIKAEIDPD